MRLAAIPSFERIPLAQIVARNPGLEEAMGEAMSRLAAAAAKAGKWPSDRITRIALLREAIRPFDVYAHQRGELQ